VKVKVYDDGGKSADRYTIVTNEPGGKTGYYAMLGLSDNPGHPQGFSQWTDGQDGTHLGKRIAFADLPDKVRQHAAARLKSEEESPVSERHGVTERASARSVRTVRMQEINPAHGRDLGIRADASTGAWGPEQGREFDVKMRRVDIPDFARSELSTDEIDAEVADGVDAALYGLKLELKEKYKWVGKVGLVGRSGGWLVIEDAERGYGSDGETPDPKRDDEWDEIQKMVSEGLADVVTSLESDEFWRETIEGRSKSVYDKDESRGPGDWSPGWPKGGKSRDSTLGGVPRLGERADVPTYWADDAKEATAAVAFLKKNGVASARVGNTVQTVDGVKVDTPTVFVSREDDPEAEGLLTGWEGVGARTERTATAGRTVTPTERIAKFREIVQQHQHAKIDGVGIDAFSASAVVQVYDQLSKPNQEKFASFPAPKMTEMAWKLIGKVRGEDTLVGFDEALGGASATTKNTPDIEWDTHDIWKARVEFLMEEPLDHDYFFKSDADLRRLADESKSDKEFLGKVEAAGLTKKLRELAEKDAAEDSDIYTWAWDSLTDIITDWMKKQDTDRWVGGVTGFGWRKQSGSTEFRASKGGDLLHKVLPKTENRFEVYLDKDEIRIQNWHHDAPTGGEWYTIKPAPAED
jgi:hypothetical protein